MSLVVAEDRGAVRHMTLETEVAAQESLVATDDFAEATRVLREKRLPQFAGR